MILALWEIFCRDVETGRGLLAACLSIPWGAKVGSLDGPGPPSSDVVRPLRPVGSADVVGQIVRGTGLLQYLFWYWCCHHHPEHRAGKGSRITPREPGTWRWPGWREGSMGAALSLAASAHPLTPACLVVATPHLPLFFCTPVPLLFPLRAFHLPTFLANGSGNSTCTSN